MQADGFAPGCTDLGSPHTCLQHRAIESASQRWQVLPKPGYAGGRMGGWAQQTGRLCCLAQERLRDRRLGHVWWLPELIYQSPPFQVLKALRRCHRYHTLDVSTDKQKGMLGDGYALVYGLVPSEWTKPLTLENSRQNCEAGSRTTLETKIVTRGKHEISAHLLRCLSPREVVLKEILTVLFAVSPL